MEPRLWATRAITAELLTVSNFRYLAWLLTHVVVGKFLKRFFVCLFVW